MGITKKDVPETPRIKVRIRYEDNTIMKMGKCANAMRSDGLSPSVMVKRFFNPKQNEKPDDILDEYCEFIE